MTDIEGEINRIRKESEGYLAGKMTESYSVKRIECLKRMAELKDVKRQENVCWKIAKESLEKTEKEIKAEIDAIARLKENTEKCCKNESLQGSNVKLGTKPKVGAGNTLRKRKYKEEMQQNC